MKGSNALALLGLIGLTRLCFASVGVYCPHSQLCIHPPYSEDSQSADGIAIKRVMAIPVDASVSQTVEISLNRNMYWASGEPASTIRTIPVQELPSRISYCIYDKGCHSLLLVGVKVAESQEFQTSPPVSVNSASPDPEAVNPMSLLAQSLSSNSGFSPPLFRYVTQPPALPSSPRQEEPSPVPDKNIEPEYQADQNDAEDRQPLVKIRSTEGLRPYVPVAQQLIGRVLAGTVYLFFSGGLKQFFFIPVPYSQIEANELHIMSDEMMLSGSGVDQAVRMDLSPVKRAVPTHLSELGFNHPGPRLKSDQLVTRVLAPSGESHYVLIAGDQLIKFASKDHLESFLRRQAQYEEEIDGLAEWVTTIGFRSYISQGYRRELVHNNNKYKIKSSNVGSQPKASEKQFIYPLPVLQPLRPVIISETALTSALKNIRAINMARDIRFLTSTHFIQPAPQQIVVGIVVTEDKKYQYQAAIRSPSFLAILEQNVDIENLVPQLLTLSIISFQSTIHDLSVQHRQRVNALFQTLISATADTAYNFAQALEAASEHSGHYEILKYMDAYTGPGQPQYPAAPVTFTRSNPPPAAWQPAQNYNPASYGHPYVASAPYSHPPSAGYRHQPYRADDRQTFSMKKMEAALPPSLPSPEVMYQRLLTQLTFSSPVLFDCLSQELTSSRFFWQLLADSLATVMVRTSPGKLTNRTNFHELFELLRQPSGEKRLSYFKKHFIEGDRLSKPVLSHRNIAELYLKLFQAAYAHKNNALISELTTTMWKQTTGNRIPDNELYSLVRTQLQTVQQFENHGAGIWFFFNTYNHQLDMPLTTPDNVPLVHAAIHKALIQDPETSYSLGDYHLGDYRLGDYHLGDYQSLKELYLNMKKVFRVRQMHKYETLAVTLAELAPSTYSYAMAGKINNNVLRSLKVILGKPETPKHFAVHFAIVTDGRILPEKTIQSIVEQQLNDPSQFHGAVKLPSKIPAPVKEPYRPAYQQYFQPGTQPLLMAPPSAHRQPQIPSPTHGMMTQPYGHQHRPMISGWNKPVYQHQVQPARSAPAPSESNTRRKTTQLHQVPGSNTIIPIASELYSSVNDISFQLNDFRTKWKIFGWFLDMGFDDLEEIEADTIPKERLHKMLRTLHENYSPAKNHWLEFNQYIYKCLMDGEQVMAAETLLLPK